MMVEIVFARNLWEFLISLNIKLCHLRSGHSVKRWPAALKLKSIIDERMSVDIYECGLASRQCCLYDLSSCSDSLQFYIHSQKLFFFNTQNVVVLCWIVNIVWTFDHSKVVYVLLHTLFKKLNRGRNTANEKLRFCDFVCNDWTCVARLSWQFLIICQTNISRQTCKFSITIKIKNK